MKPSAAPPLRPEPAVWSRRYERLREQALTGDATGLSDAWGVALLIGQGLTGWMRGWQEWPSPGAAATPAPEAPPRRLASPWHQEAARLLANMALNQLKPPSSGPPL